MKHKGRVKVISSIVIGLAASIVVAAAYIRLAPVSVARAPVPASLAVGEYPVAGGYYAVRKIPDADYALSQITSALSALPRTRKVSDAPLTFVTRSALWAFPDVIRLWVELDTLHIAGHSIYGKSDRGVNKARITAILASAGL
jgi:uncharacterized protein (DUF1499 family)